MMRHRFCTVRIWMLALLIGVQGAGFGLILGQDAAQLRESDARQQEKHTALEARVQALQAQGEKRQDALDSLKRDMAVLQAEIATARWLLGMMFAGIAGLLGEAGFRLHLYRRAQGGRKRG